MTKKNYFAAFAATLFFCLFAASCQPRNDDTPEEATLTISTNSIVLTNSLQKPNSPQVTVTTNQPKFIVSTNSEWIITEINGNGIIIGALANEFGKDRKGDVLVFAGGLVEKIEVTQSAADIVLDISPNEIKAPRTGKELIIAIESNTNSWELKLADPKDSEWISLERHKSLVKVSIKANKNSSERSTKIFASAGAIMKEINVLQQGVGSVDFLLPLMKRKPTGYEILSHEFDQGSFILEFYEAVPPFRLEETYTFAYGSRAFQKCEYYIDTTKGSIKNIFLFFEKDRNKSPIATQEFQDYLKSNGFKNIKVDTEGKLSAIYDGEDTFEVNTMYEEYTNQGALVFVPIIKQNKEYPTFKNNIFPWDMVDRLNSPKWTSKAIAKAEKETGGVVSIEMSKDFPELTNYIEVILKENNDRDYPFNRTYFIDTDEQKGTSTDLASQLFVVWKDVELIAYEDGKTFILTNEFKELMTKNGFKFHAEVSAGQLWYNKEKHLMILPRGGSYSSILEGAPVCSINYYEEVINEPSAIQLQKISEDVIKKDMMLGKIK